MSLTEVKFHFNWLNDLWSNRTQFLTFDRNRNFVIDFRGTGSALHYLFRKVPRDFFSLTFFSFNTVC